MNNDDAIRIMLNAAPICGTVWNREGRSVDCNDAALRFFGLTSKQAWLDHHADLSAQCQPDGTASALLMRAYLRQAFAQGQAEFSWLHRRLDGELMPTQLTLTRVCHDDREWVLAYAVALPIPLADRPAGQGGNVRASMLLDNAPWACILWNAREEIVDCNVEAFQRFGLDSKHEYLERFTEFLPEFQPCGVRSTELMRQYVARALQTGRLTIPWMYRSAAGEPMPCEVTLVHTMEDNEPMLATYVRDLWEEQRLAAEKRAADERIQIMLDSTPACITFWSWDEQLRLIDCNQEAANRFDLGSKQDYLDHFNELSPEYQPDGYLSAELIPQYIQQALRDGYLRIEWMHRLLNGNPLPAEITLVRVRRAEGYVIAAYVRDLRELKESVASLRRLEKLAYTDKLTGVANRHGFMDNAIVELEKLAPDDSASLLMFDIDHFKQVNDTYGHIAGDMILHDVAERIQTILRPYDLFARYGGEEFVLLLTHTSLSTTHSLAERVRDAIAQSPFEYRGMAIAITISIGVASCGSPALPLQDLLDLADTALYHAKRLGRNRVEHASSLQPSARTVASG